jgi:hypothetical protein
MVAQGLKVEGIPEATRAFDKVSAGIQDLSKAHKAEADMLLHDVQAATRRKSGDLIAGWETDGIATAAKFINQVVYAGVQEFGWAEHGIEPTGAITKAFESNATQTEAIYGDAIGDIARAAGFDVK